MSFVPPSPPVNQTGYFRSPLQAPNPRAWRQEYERSLEDPYHVLLRRLDAMEHNQQVISSLLRQVILRLDQVRPDTTPLAHGDRELRGVRIRDRHNGADESPNT